MKMKIALSVIAIAVLSVLIAVNWKPKPEPQVIVPAPAAPRPTRELVAEMAYAHHTKDAYVYDLTMMAGQIYDLEASSNKVNWRVVGTIDTRSWPSGSVHRMMHNVMLGDAGPWARLMRRIP